MKTTIVVGIDIGGTNIHIGFTDISGNILKNVTLATKNYPMPDSFVDATVPVILEACQQNNWALAGIGMGAPNGNFYTGAIEFAPNMPWKGIVPLAKMIQNKCHVPAFLTNDANAAAIGEMTFGIAKGMKDFILITLGTGLGSGIIANGKLIYGHDGLAGELGPTIAIKNGRPCGCGRKGCLETYASATGIVTTVKEMIDAGMQGKINKDNISALSIYQAALDNDELALAAFDFTAKILGESLADAVAYTSPEAIIFFGGLVNSGEILLKPLRTHFEINLLKIYQNKVKILQSALPESNAAILGAASLIWNQSQNKN